MLTKDLDGPLDKCEDLGESEMENLRGWVERFDEKVSSTFRYWTRAMLTRLQYLVVGKLIAFRETDFH
jgi:hypothetical protein